MIEFRESFGDDEEAWRLFLDGYRAQNQGRCEEAVSLYKISAQRRPTAEAYTFMGWALSMLKRLDEAIACCRKAIEVDPDFGNPYNDIGSYLMAQGKHREAIPWFGKAIRARRYEPRQFPHCNLGILHEELGDYEAAIKHYKRALEIEPRHQTARARRRRLIAMRN